jgi:hypothetical protein
VHFSTKDMTHGNTNVPTEWIKSSHLVLMEAILLLLWQVVKSVFLSIIGL